MTARAAAVQGNCPAACSHALSASSCSVGVLTVMDWHLHAADEPTLGCYVLHELYYKQLQAWLGTGTEGGHPLAPGLFEALWLDHNAF